MSEINDVRFGIKSVALFVEKRMTLFVVCHRYRSKPGMSPGAANISRWNTGPFFGECKFRQPTTQIKHLCKIRNDI